MFKNLKINERLKKSFRIVTLFASVSGVIGAIMLLVVTNQYEDALINYGFSQGDIGKAMIVFTDIRSTTRGIIGYDDTNLISNLQKTHAERKEKFEEYWDVVENTLSTDEERDAYDDISSHLTEYWKIEEEVINIGATTETMASRQAQNLMYEKINPLYQEIYDDMLALLDVNVNQGNSLSATLQTLSIILIITIFAIIVIAYVISSRLGTSIAKNISDPLIALAARFETFAKGNLKDAFPVVDTQDEIADMIATANQMRADLDFVISDADHLLSEMGGGNFNCKSHDLSMYQGEFARLLGSMKNLRDRMVETIRSIGDASGQVSAGAHNMADASQGLAEGATEQAGAVEELQATITTIKESMDIASTQAYDAYVQAKKYADEADNSREQMKTMTAAMDISAKPLIKLAISSEKSKILPVRQTFFPSMLLSKQPEPEKPEEALPLLPIKSVHLLNRVQRLQSIPVH